MMTLDLRESRSSLAGVLMAAAMEGVGVFEFANHVISPEAAAAATPPPPVVEPQNAAVQQPVVAPPAPAEPQNPVVQQPVVAPASHPAAPVNPADAGSGDSSDSSDSSDTNNNDDGGTAGTAGTAGEGTSGGDGGDGGDGPNGGNGGDGGNGGSGPGAGDGGDGGDGGNGPYGGDGGDGGDGASGIPGTAPPQSPGGGSQPAPDAPAPGSGGGSAPVPPDLSGSGGAYPGDNASAQARAAWMGAEAQKRGLPPELPLMASLVESGMKNLSYGDADSVGYFQMRQSIWNKGAYAGYGKHPELQVKWFLDQAAAVKAQRVAAGKPIDSSHYGEWIADIERPAAQYRGRYQLRLDDARQLLKNAGRNGGSNAGVYKAVGADQAAGVVAGSASGGGAGMVAVARSQLGQHESPMGSNNSSRIAQYRSAVPGGGVGPWCAYFASWVAKENGMPLGERGQGYARVDDIWSWAQRTGRTTGSNPRPGDLVVWDEHIGVVESVRSDGSIQTIEGNSSDQVSRRVYRPGPPIIGFVSMSGKR
jgi:hypothetical protein